MNNILIKEANLQDIATIVNFNKNMAMETEGKPLDRTTLKKGVEAVMQDSQKGFYLIAEIDGKQAGCLLITKEWSDWRNGYFWWIQSVYVKNKMRKKGVFSALYKYVKKLANKEENVVGLRLYVAQSNKIAQKTYKKIGMNPTHYLIYEES